MAQPACLQELMRAAPTITNVVEACNIEGRLEILDSMLTQLELCEKALQDYLETERIAFPRFYFVAPADLLDILSKGSDPHAIIRCDIASRSFHVSTILIFTFCIGVQTPTKVLR